MTVTRTTFGTSVLIAPVLTALLAVGLVAGGSAGVIPASALLLLAVASPFVAWRTIATGNRRLLLGVQGLALTVAGVVIATTPVLIDAPHRLLRLAIVLVAVAGATTLTLGQLRPAHLRAALAVGLGVPLALFLADLAVPYPQAGPAPGRPEWRATLVDDSLLGARYLPDTAFVTTYPNDGGGDHDARDFRERIWGLVAFPGNAAALDLPAGARGEVGVRIAVADTGPAWHIQLNQAGLVVQTLRGYTVRFRIRADSARSVGVGFLQAHEPWTVIGFYRTLAVDTTWSEFNEYFIAGIADDDARLAFDLGGSDVSVTIRDVSIEDEFGAPVTPPLPLHHYEVRYAFDGDGCRRTPPAAEGQAAPAVLVLGDGDAFGLGVRQQDVLASQLATGIAPKGDLHARNCAVPGADPATAIARYRALGGGAPPATVLYVLGPETADRLRRDATAASLQRLPAPLRLSSVLARLARVETTQWEAIVKPMADNLRQLAVAVRSDGGRLTVAYFRADSNPGWPVVIAAVDSALAGVDATTIDLGRHLADSLPLPAILNDEPGRHPNALAHRIAAAALRLGLPAGEGPLGSKP